jgi:hypothetical protein
MLWDWLNWLLGRHSVDAIPSKHVKAANNLERLAARKGYKSSRVRHKHHAELVRPKRFGRTTSPASSKNG